MFFYGKIGSGQNYKIKFFNIDSYNFEDQSKWLIVINWFVEP